MWEDLTIGLACTGFLVMLMLELPAVLHTAQDYARLHHQRHR